MGWLLATPEGSQENRAKMFGESLPELPPSETLDHIWHSIGMAQVGMNGAEPFSWQEVQAYAALTGWRSTPTEAQCLVDMSRAYCAGIADKNPLSKAPMERTHD